MQYLERNQLKLLCNMVGVLPIRQIRPFEFIYDGNAKVLPYSEKKVVSIQAERTLLLPEDYTIVGKVLTFVGDMVFINDKITVKFSI